MSDRHLDARGFDDLSRAERGAALAHALECAACRERLVEDDPSRVFALLALRSIPEEDLDDVSSRVATAIDREGTSRLAPRVAAWAASILLAAVTAGLLLVNEPGGPGGGKRSVATLSPAGVEATARLELLSSPGDAEVVDLTVGETQLIMIFDQDVEL